MVFGTLNRFEVGGPELWTTGCGGRSGYSYWTSTAVLIAGRRLEQERSPHSLLHLGTRRRARWLKVVHLNHITLVRSITSKGSLKHVREMLTISTF